MVTGLAWVAVVTPVGDLYVACSTAGLARVSFGPPPGHPGPPPARAAVPGARALAAEAARQVESYFAGRLREFRLPVDWSWASQAQRQVLSALIGAAGYGETVTYGELARRAGLSSEDGTRSAARAQPDPAGQDPAEPDSTQPDSTQPGPGGRRGSRPAAQPFLPARVVGQVMGANQCPVIIPCHRVVAGNGLGGYSGGTGVEIKRWLLTFEGALPPTLDWDPTGGNLPR